MNLTLLLAELASRGITLSSEGGYLRIRGNRRELTAQIEESIKIHKAELLALLATQKQDGPSTAQLERAQSSGPAPLTSAQSRLWFLHQLQPWDSQSNICFGLRLFGHLNIAALQRSIQEIVRRHDILRTVFKFVDGQLCQQTLAEFELELELIDLRGQSEPAAQESQKELFVAHGLAPFDLSAKPPTRIKLVQISEDQSILLIAQHHIITDAASVGIFISELMELYSGFALGRQVALPPLPLQYKDYAHWQHQQLAQLAALKAWWKNYLQGTPRLQIPVCASKTAEAGAGSHSITLSAKLSTAAKQLARQEQCTQFVVLLAAYSVILSRYCGQTDFGIPISVANRERAELKRLIGYFADNIVVRCDLSGRPSFSTLISRLRIQMAEVLAHSELPYAEIVAAFGGKREEGGASPFRAGFILENYPAPKLELPGLSVQPILHSPDGSLGKSARFDLGLIMAEAESGMQAVFEYSTNLFDEPAMARFAEQFQVLLQSLTADPEQSIATAPLLTQEEQRQILGPWACAQRREYPQLCFQEMFARTARSSPAAKAVVFCDESITYEALHARVCRLAQRLRALGVGPGTLIGLCLERSIDMVVGVLGILEAGAAYVPLDPDYPQERLAFMLQDTATKVLLTQPHLRSRLPAVVENTVELHDEADSSVAADAPILEPRAVTLDDLAYVIYTSGSTGQPKGVMLSHRGLTNLCGVQQELFPVTPADRILLFPSLSFDASLFAIVHALAQGAVLVIAHVEATRSQLELSRLLEEQAITVAAIPPGMLSLLEPRFPALRLVICSGERCSESLARAWSTAGVTFINGYGPTEYTIATTFHRCSPSDVGPPSIGRPLANTEIYILDTALQPVPQGVPGELHIGGAGLARGYLNRPALTAERFIKNPFSSSKGVAPYLYKTGDLVRFRPDGALDFIGRIDYQVKVRGFRVELGEIESVLSELPQVRQCAVVARPDPAGSVRIIAYVVSDGSMPLLVDTLREGLSKRLPDYMMPAAFVVLDALPLTPNDKVDREALPEPESARPQLSVSYEAPSTEMEQRIAAVWQEVLGLPQVGVQDNFFDLGGDSLRIVKIHAKLCELLKQEIEITDVLRYPTVRALAERLKDSPTKDTKSGIVAASKERARQRLQARAQLAAAGKQRRGE